MNPFIEANLIEEMKVKKPLVLHFTNAVTINDCANTALTIGASPIMGDAIEEVEDLIKICHSVVLNIGTLNASQQAIFLEAGRIANQLGKPIILDPVGVFASQLRMKAVEELLTNVKFDVIKGNMSEIAFLAGIEAKGKGVDADEDIDINIDEIKQFSRKIATTIAATGEMDVITNGEKAYTIHNGCSKLKAITGTGCMTASLVGSYVGLTNDVLQAATMGVLTMSLSGELANHNHPAIGSYKMQLFDEMYTLNHEKIHAYAKVEER